MPTKKALEAEIIQLKKRLAYALAMMEVWQEMMYRKAYGAEDFTKRLNYIEPINDKKESGDVK